MSKGHKWVKLKRDCMYGNKGKVVQLLNAFAAERVRLGHAEYCDEPKGQIARREAIEKKKIETKALSAAG